jgi:hypothetical protein
MRSRVELMALELMAGGARLSKYDLADAAQCDQRTAGRMLARIHKAGIGVRICGWVSIYRAWIPTYRKAPGVDVVRPKPMSGAERARRRRRDAEVRWNEMMIKRGKRLLERSARILTQPRGL